MRRILLDGVVVEVAEAPEERPTEKPPARVPHYKFRLALAMAGLLEQAEAHVASLPMADRIRVAWDARADVVSDSLLFDPILRAGLITQEQLDALFVSASEVP